MVLLSSQKDYLYIHGFTISICDVRLWPKLPSLMKGRVAKELGQLQSLSLRTQEAMSISVVITEKKGNFMFDKSYTSTRDIYLQKLPLLLTLQMNQSLSVRYNDKKTNDRYKLLQIYFEENTFIYGLGTNFVHSFIFLRTEKCDLIQLVLPVSERCQWSLNPKEFTFYIKIYAVMHKMLNLRFWKFRSIFQRVHLSVWVDICFVNIFHK